MNLYQVTIACYTRETITVRADSIDEAGDIARDVFLEKPGYGAVREASLEINLLKEPESKDGKGYLCAMEPTINKNIKLHESP
jgi:hypothetical protein